ncbi:MAG TPA: helix-turn-helix transcriptional regulator [Actinokineospora sp.]|jgi:transcriptional regulator with XRE-family HTH domain|nr:helix-turn-helix transcriptional regulator [Actinokineospora sp.]
MTANSARMRGLAAELKQIRKDANITMREVSEQTGFSLAKLSRIENAIREISLVDTASLAAVYRVTGDERAKLLDLAANVHQSSWWAFAGTHASAPAPLHWHLSALIAFEKQATRIVHAAMLRVPGLLQTPDYIRAVMMTGRVPVDRARVLIETRLRRQEILRKANAPRYLAILDEGVLRRRMGSAELMAGQARHLCEMAELPNVDIRVITFDTGLHAGLEGSFSLMGFAAASPVVFIEHGKSAVYLHEEDEISAFQGEVSSMVKAALSSADSVRFLRRLQASYSRE